MGYFRLTLKAWAPRLVVKPRRSIDWGFLELEKFDYCRTTISQQQLDMLQLFRCLWTL